MGGGRVWRLDAGAPDVYNPQGERLEASEMFGDCSTRRGLSCAPDFEARARQGVRILSPTRHALTRLHFLFTSLSLVITPASSLSPHRRRSFWLALCCLRSFNRHSSLHSLTATLSTNRPCHHERHLIHHHSLVCSFWDSSALSLVFPLCRKPRPACTHPVETP
jgi:hypothetical protein